MFRRINKLRCLKNRHSLVPSLAQQAAPHPPCRSTDKMLCLTVLSCLVCLHGLIGSVCGADKYTDENRPYEFGFTIDGEQHRHEKKDENGIIMGEFGFITADGVYHVTVYATDENGRFKILSMKNIRVKPYPTSGGGVKKGHSIPFPPSENAPSLQGPALNPQQQSKPLQINKQAPSPAKSCSHCSLPTTTTKAPPPQLNDIAIVSKDRPTPGPISSNNYQQSIQSSTASGQNSFSQQKDDTGNSFSKSYLGQQTNPSSTGFDQHNPTYPQAKPQQESSEGVKQNYDQQSFSGNPISRSPNSPKINYPQDKNNENPNISQTNEYYQQREDNANQNIPQVGNNSPQNNPSITNSGVLYPTQEDVRFNNPQKKVNSDQSYTQQQPNNAQSATSYVQPPLGQQPSHDLQTPKDTLRSPKQYNEIPTSNVRTGPLQEFGSGLESHVNQPISNRPTLLAAQMQIVPKDTNIYHRNPDEEEGLPNGLSKDDMVHLLYTFNYTVGFHGHQEEGYSNGVKKGYYYVTGRNGIRTRIDYIADEKGFRPKISQEVLDLLSDDVPKAETEKDEKFGLKGYEFKWIYYPKNERK